MSYDTLISHTFSIVEGQDHNTIENVWEKHDIVLQMQPLEGLS